MEQNQRVSSVFFNTNVRNGMCERLSWGSRAGGWGKEEWSRPQLSLKVVAASGALARLDTFSPKPGISSSSHNDSTNLVWSAYWCRRTCWVAGWPTAHTCSVDLVKPITLSRPHLPHLQKGKIHCLYFFIAIKWGVCETIKQQKNGKNSITRNNHLFGTLFLMY